MLSEPAGSPWPKSNLAGAPIRHARPDVLLDCLDEGEEARLCDWLHATGYVDVVQATIDLHEQDRAA